MTDDKSIPISKPKRLGALAKTGLKLAKVEAKHRFYPGEKKSQSDHNRELAQTLYTTLSQLRGTALKAAQVLSQEIAFLPAEFKEVFSKGCYQAPPLNQAVARKVLQESLGPDWESELVELESPAFAAASIGQVHRAKLSTGMAVAVKIQYPGIDLSIQNDMTLLERFFLKLPLPGFSKQKPFLQTAVTELKSRFLEECNYRQEAAYAQLFFDNSQGLPIHVSKPILKVCSDTVLVTQLLSGVPIEKWLDTNPSQDLRNHIGQQIWDFFVTHFLKFGLIHADPNPGNYMVCEDGHLGVIDFGCVKQVSAGFPAYLQRILAAHLSEDYTEVIPIFYKLGMISSLEISHEELKETLSLFREWITYPLHSTFFDFGSTPHYLGTQFSKGVEDSLELIHNTTPDFVMFVRTYTGLISLLIKLKATISMQSILEAKDRRA
jgi:predicted unusual protein kinase regulating ubiquinone biosynthesis (AarF/ABC1/UbiB family)